MRAWNRTVGLVMASSVIIFLALPWVSGGNADPCDPNCNPCYDGQVYNCCFRACSYNIQFVRSSLGNPGEPPCNYPDQPLY
jgi:hypothetical protein